MYSQRIPGITPNSMNHNVIFQPIVEMVPKLNHLVRLPTRQYQAFIGCTKQRKVTICRFEGQWLISFTDNACTNWNMAHNIKVTIRLYTGFCHNTGPQGLEAVIWGRPTPESRTISTVLPDVFKMNIWTRLDERAASVEIAVEDRVKDKKRWPIRYNFFQPNRTTDLIVLLDDGTKLFVDTKFLSYHSDFFGIARLRMPRLPIDPMTNLNCLRIPGISSRDLVILLHYIYPNPNLEVEGRADILLPTARLLEFPGLLTRLKLGRIPGNCRTFCWRLHYVIENGFHDIKDFMLNKEVIDGKVKDEEYYSQLSDSIKEMVEAALDKRTEHPLELKAYWWMRGGCDSVL